MAGDVRARLRAVVHRVVRGSAASSTRPTARRAAPFVAVAAVGVAGAIATHDGSVLSATAMLLTFAAALGFVALSLQRDERTWVDPAGPFLFFLVIALARDNTGDARSGVTALLLLPVLWLAVTGTRTDLAVATVLMAATFLVPMALVGAPRYPATDWVPALLWVAFAAVVAPVVQDLVRHLSVAISEARETAGELDGLLRGAVLSSVVSTDVDGVVRSFGTGAEKLLGHRADDVTGRVRLDELHDRDEVDRAAAERGCPRGFAVLADLAGDGAESRTWRMVRADGRLVDVREVLTVLRDPDGTVTGYLSVAIDATQAVAAERALVESEARWRILMDHLPDTTVMMLDGEAQIKVVAGAGSMRQGLQQAVGRPLADFSKPPNYGLLRHLVSEALAGREGAVELVATATGTEQEVTVTPLPADADGVRHALLLSRDVGEQRRRQRAVVRAKERAERLFADAPHGIALLDAAGTILQVNDALGDLLGPVPDGVVGRRLESFTAPGGAGDAETLRAALTTRDTDDLRWTLRHADGHDVHAVVSSRILVGDGGAAGDDRDQDDAVLVNVVDISERVRIEERLAHQADHDPLTGLVNRRRFDEELAAHLARCERDGLRGAVVLLDLDHFKEVNDTLGHAAGDRLIVSIAALVRAGTSPGDLVARLGGDEFAVLLPTADQHVAERVAQAIVDRVRAHTAALEGTRRRVTASVGVVTLRAASEHQSDVLALADMTMYDAKDAGRNGYVVLEEALQQEPRSGVRLQWRSRIERAIERGDLVLHLQPILDLRSGEVRSAEALLRLADQDPLVPPSRFLPVAERSDLMPQLDAWVVEHGVAMLGRLRALQPDFQLEVNLSGRSIGDPHLERTIVSSLARHDVDPAALILEITETAAVADIEVARQFAQRMSVLGCRFALDDFGAGYGSFAYLKHLLFDYVKIDGEFVATCDVSHVDRSIVRSVVGIARALGKQTVAEFVETQAVLDAVREDGVDLAQGYFIGRPVELDEFVQRFLPGALPAVRTGA